MVLNDYVYELLLDLIAGAVFIGSCIVYWLARPRPAKAAAAAVAHQSSAASQSWARETVSGTRVNGGLLQRHGARIATGDAALSTTSDADGASDADDDADDDDATPKIIHVRVRFTGELARMAESPARRAIPRFCLECLQEARAMFPNLEARGLPRRCARHRIRLDEWIRVGEVCLHRHRPAFRGREINN